MTELLALETVLKPIQTQFLFTLQLILMFYLLAVVAVVE
jgi:hypothetical protein